MVSVYLLRGRLGIVLDSPAMGRFVLGFAVSALIDRFKMVPSALLVRDLRFRTVALVNSVGELTFTGTALSLAPRYGGYAMMFSAIARSIVTFVLFAATAPRAEWLKPSPFEKAVVRHLFGYGARKSCG